MGVNTALRWQATNLQKSMLLASKKEKDNPAYVNQLVLALSSDLQVPDVINAWNKLVHRHSILRSQFTFEGTECYLYLLDDWDGSNCYRFEAVTNEKQAEQAYYQDYNKAFAIDTALPLWRILFIDCMGSLHLCLTMHHAIRDKRTEQILLKELDVLLSNNPSSAINFPDVAGFEDYLEWQLRQDFSNFRSDWLEYIAPLQQASHLPEERNGPDNINGPSLRFEVHFEQSLTNKLREYSSQSGLTPNLIVMGAWALVLSRLTFSDTVCFGVLREGRANTLPDARDIAGPMIKTLPFIAPVFPDLRTSAYLSELKQRWKFLYRVEHCQSELLSSWAEIAEEVFSFGTLFNYLKLTTPEPMGIRGPSKANLVSRRYTRILEPAVGVIEGVTFSIRLITSPQYETASRIAVEALPQVVNQFVSDDQTLRDISLDPLHRKRMLDDARGPDRRLANSTLHALVEQAFSRCKDSLALRGTINKTYAELEEDSCRVASILNLDTYAVQRPVAIVLPRGSLCITVMIATIRSGGCFICLNPDMPTQELRAILAAVSPHIVVVTDASDLDDLSCRVIADSEFTQSGSRRFSFQPRAGPRDLAYLVHTSGTTSAPKVVQIEQHSAANLVASMLPIYRITSEDRRLALSQPGPDFFLAEVLITLCGGASLVLTEPKALYSSAEFMDQIKDHGVTVTGMPSSYWHELMRTFRDDNEINLPSSLRLMIVGMESIDLEMLQKWIRHAPEQVELLNVYGPCEATMINTVYSLRNGVFPGTRHIPVGKPISNTCVYILDKAGQLMPRGATGEICISGAGLMRGYIDNTTGQPLVPNPHDERSGFSKLYRTGDFGFMDEAGNIVFAGRHDGQVKIRGHRVELQFVEAQLSLVAEGAAAVALQLRRNNRNILVGLIESESAFATAPIKTRLRAQLRPIFVPSEIFYYQRFPRLPNGRIDRRQLHTDVEQQVSTRKLSAYLCDQDDFQIASMISIWNEVFGRNDCSPDSDFFDLGGDSLTATHLVHRVEQMMGHRMSIAECFDYPLLRELAAKI